MTDEKEDLTGRMVFARLIGGPLNGQTIKVHKSTEVYNVGGFFTYEYGGKEDNMLQLVIRPKSRVARRAVRRYIERTGTHPAVEFERHKRQPHRKPKGT